MSRNTKAAAAADLDAFLSEVFGEGPKVTLYGKTWYLRADLPATVMLELKAVAETDGEYEANLTSELDLLRKLMAPAEQVDELLALGLGIGAFEVLLRVAIGLYMGVPADKTLDAMRAERAAVEAKDEADSPKG